MIPLELMMNTAPELAKYEIASIKRLMAVMRRRNRKKMYRAEERKMDRLMWSEPSTVRRLARGCVPSSLGNVLISDVEEA
ncbi:MAG: hypothetical protein OXE02_03350 [Chloroflexi bacterium]|nr:hypothetical protein [Chloroflexota bacterium]